MDKLKLAFLNLFSKNQLEKEIHKIHYQIEPLPVNEEQLQVFFDGIDGKFQGLDIEKISELLLNTLKHSQNWVQAMQILYIMQKICTYYGSNFTNVTMKNLHLNPIDMHQVLEKHSSKRDIVLHVPLATSYLNYIQGLLKVYDFRIMCSEVLRQKKLDLIFKMPFDKLFLKIFQTLENMRKFLINSGFLIQQSLMRVKNNQLMKQIGAHLLSDLIVQYDANSSIVQILTEDLLEITDDEALKLYSLYEEIIIITKELKKFYELKDYLEIPFLKSPQYFNFELEKNKKIEHHVNKLRLQQKDPNYDAETRGRRMTISYQTKKQDIKKLNQRFQNILRSKSVLVPGSTLKDYVRNQYQQPLLTDDGNSKSQDKEQKQESKPKPLEIKTQTLNIGNKKKSNLLDEDYNSPFNQKLSEFQNSPSVNQTNENFLGEKSEQNKNEYQHENIIDSVSERKDSFNESEDQEKEAIIQKSKKNETQQIEQDVIDSDNEDKGKKQKNSKKSKKAKKQKKSQLNSQKKDTENQQII